MVDIICAGWTAVSILIIMIALAATAATGRHDADYALGNYDKSLSGWGGFTFFIGLLPAAYTFSAIGSRYLPPTMGQDARIMMLTFGSDHVHV